ncbi:DNA-binding domain-containing protein [Klebsiella aerogenes]|uniref:DNA-binding domain-containing protein n=1 Tax=Klebsiella aerogenes TaxID=548 RepID=UPI002E3019A9|nr:DNA-binding domain-containing protein [Klebsiella aerogenes]
MQNSLYQALLEQQSLPPAGLTVWNGSDPAVRFAVYRNNIMSSLTDALAENCPVLQKQVGDVFFRAMAAEFIRQHPPSSPVLAGYGDALPAWIASFPPLSEWPWLADLTRLELLFIDVLHAAETTSLVFKEQLARLAQTGLARLTAGLVPTVRLFSSPYAIFSLWAAHQQEVEPLAVDPWQPEKMLLFRSGDDVRIALLCPAEFTFMVALQAGNNLAQATLQARAYDGGFEPGALLLRLHQNRLLGWLISTEEK